VSKARSGVTLAFSLSQPAPASTARAMPGVAAKKWQTRARKRPQDEQGQQVRDLTGIEV